MRRSYGQSGMALGVFCILLHCMVLIASASSSSYRHIVMSIQAKSPDGGPSNRLGLSPLGTDPGPSLFDFSKINIISPRPLRGADSIRL